MKQRIVIAVFVIVCLALVAVSIDSVNCHRANVMLRHTVLSQANEILKLGNNPHTESTIMYVGLKK